MKLDSALLAILACPACRGELQADDPASRLVCTDCGRAYPVRDDIPVLLVDEATRPDPADPHPAATVDPAATAPDES